MKPIIAIILLLLAFACQNNTQKKQGPSSENQGTPKFAFLQEFHNFGTLQAGEIVAYSFRFTNTGDGDLVIEKAESDCGCITVEFPREAIHAQEAGFVEIIFNSSGEVGKVYKEIILYSNTEPNKTKLAIAATVQNELINIYSKN